MAINAAIGDPLGLIIGVILVFYGVRLLAEGLHYLSQRSASPLVCALFMAAGCLMFPVGLPPILAAMGLI